MTFFFAWRSSRFFFAVARRSVDQLRQQLHVDETSVVKLDCDANARLFVAELLLESVSRLVVDAGVFPLPQSADCLLQLGMVHVFFSEEQTIMSAPVVA